MTLIERFNAKVRRGRETDCDVWTGAKNAKDYGRFNLNGKNRHAHRASWELNVGPIPQGLFVCHRCDNRSCVKVEHLFLGTNTDNMRDMRAKGRENFLRGEDNPRAKLSASDIPIIRASSLTNGEIAKIYGLAPASISLIRKGINWRHI